MLVGNIPRRTLAALVVVAPLAPALVRAQSGAFFPEEPHVGIEATCRLSDSLALAVAYSSDNCAAVDLAFEYRESLADPWLPATIVEHPSQPIELVNGCGTLEVSWDFETDLGSPPWPSGAQVRAVAVLASGEGRMVATAATNLDASPAVIQFAVSDGVQDDVALSPSTEAVMDRRALSFAGAHVSGEQPPETILHFSSTLAGSASVVPLVLPGSGGAYGPTTLDATEFPVASGYELSSGPCGPAFSADAGVLSIRSLTPLGAGNPVASIHSTQFQ